MITVLHGDNIVASRKALSALKEKYAHKEIRDIDGSSLDESMLVQALSSSSLFGSEHVVIIERLLATLGRKSKKSEALLIHLVQEKDTPILLWEGKEVTKTVLSQLGKHVEVQLFKLPSNLFQFIDGIRPRATKQLLSQYQQLIDHEAPELVHALLCRRLKQLLSMKSGTVPDGVSPWQLSRLTNQARFFTMDELTQAYELLRMSELARNTGTAVLSLEETTMRWLRMM